MMMPSADPSTSWTALVETSASAKPASMVRVFISHGAGKSLMLPLIAPSVAGCPAAKPKISDAPIETVATPPATLRPLTMCCPTNSFSSFGERVQEAMAGIFRLASAPGPLSRACGRGVGVRARDAEASRDRPQRRFAPPSPASAGEGRPRPRNSMYPYRAARGTSSGSHAFTNGHPPFSNGRNASSGAMVETILKQSQGPVDSAAVLIAIR